MAPFLRHALAYALPAPSSLLFTKCPKLPTKARQACRKAGVPEFDIRTLRHSAATWMVTAGVPYEVVAKYLGHGSTTMLQRVYGNLAPAGRRRPDQRTHERCGMKLYLRGNVWWARWTEDGQKRRRSCKTTHEDEAARAAASWGRKVDAVNARPPKVVRPPNPGLVLGGRTPGVVYFAHARGTDRIKIGFTQGDVLDRLRHVQNGCPYPLDLLASLRATKLEEHHYHQIFTRDRVMTFAEWFTTGPEIMHAVAMAKVGRSVCPRCTRPTGQ